MRDIEAENCTLLWLAFLNRMIRDAAGLANGSKKRKNDINGARRYFLNQTLSNDGKIIENFKDDCDLNGWDFDRLNKLVLRWQKRDWDYRTMRIYEECIRKASKKIYNGQDE